jgi:aspartate racemase
MHPDDGSIPHIGIVACAGEGAALCFRTICSEGPRLLGPHMHPQVSIHSRPLADYLPFFDRGDWHRVAELMLGSAEKLARAGAEFLICPANTLHHAFPFLEERSPLPWMHIVDVVADHAAQQNCRRLGLTGTRWLVESELYPERMALHGIEVVRPSAADRDLMNRIIVDELIAGTFTTHAVVAFEGVIERLKADGCDAVVLGCTEIPLIISDANSALPTLDSTRLLATAALRRSVQARTPIAPLPAPDTLTLS